MILTEKLPPVTKIHIPKPRPAIPFPIGLVVDPWAEEHGILLVGTLQDVNDLYYDGFDPSLTVDPTTVEGYEEAMQGLKQLPDHVIVAMEPQYNHHSGRMETKAVYFSTAPNRGYADIMPKDYSDKYLVGVHTGFILEQKTVDWGKYALHECGHIVDLVGTNRGGYYWEPIWNLADEINRIFDATGDLISDYAKTNSHEDFAEHFSYYVWKGTTFRARMIENIDLQERYYFLKDYLFQGIEYEDPPPPPVTVLEGYVIDNGGKPIEGVRIYAKRVGATIYFADSDETGYFRSERLDEGEWIIWAEKEGYIKSDEITINLVLGVPIELNFVLRSLPPPPPPVLPPLPTWQIMALVLGAVGVIGLVYLAKSDG